MPIKFLCILVCLFLNLSALGVGVFLFREWKMTPWSIYDWDYHIKLSSRQWMYLLLFLWTSGILCISFGAICCSLLWFLVKFKHEQRRVRPTRESTCIICCNNPKEMVVSPCGHFYACQMCSIEEKKSSDICAMCRVVVKERLRLFS
jgi:hypothetical protein